MSRALALALLVIVAAAYAVGWRRLAQRSASALTPWRPLATAAGLCTFAVAVASPLAVIAHERFAAHMLQHVLMTMIAVPLILSADPFAAIIWSLPRRLRRAVGRLLARASPLRSVAAIVVAPGVAWTLSTALVWLWHVPVLYDLALASEAWHAVEHVAFVVAAVVFWWPVLAPAPRLRCRPAEPVQVAYLVLAALANGGLAVVLASAARPFYAAYTGASDALDDQALGGVVMWAVGGGVDMAAILLVVWRIFTRSGPRALTVPRGVRENGLV